VTRADRVPPEERRVQNAEMRCEDEVSASYVRVDCPTRHHGTLLHLPVSCPLSLSLFSLSLSLSVSLSSCARARSSKRSSPSLSENVAAESHVFVRRCWNYYVSRWGLWVPAVQGVITFFVVINFSLATFMDPGVIPKGNLKRVLRLVTNRRCGA